MISFFVIVMKFCEMKIPVTKGKLKRRAANGELEVSSESAYSTVAAPSSNNLFTTNFMVAGLGDNSAYTVAGMVFGSIDS